MSSYESKVKRCNRLSALLMALLLILQFVPYWHYGEGDALSASINGFVWFPHHHDALTEELTAQHKGYSINPIAWTTVGLFVLCAAGAVLCLYKSHASPCAMLPLLAGLLGLGGYLSTPALRAGSLYYVQLALFALMLISAVATIAFARSGRKAGA